MNEALRTIIYIAIFSGIITTFSSCTKNQKYLNYVISLFIILALISPFQSFLESLHINDFEHHQTDIEKTPTHNQTIALAIKEDLQQKFKLDQDAIDVQCEICDENYINNLTIEINNDEYFRYAERLNLYAKSQYGCDAQIIQNFGE